jgi:hypothetical protein
VPAAIASRSVSLIAGRNPLLTNTSRMRSLNSARRSGGTSSVTSGASTIAASQIGHPNAHAVADQVSVTSHKGRAVNTGAASSEAVRRAAAQPGRAPAAP